MANKTNFQPKWINEAPKKGSYRSIFKYGNPNGFKHPNSRLFEEIKRVFNLSDNDFKTRESTGNELVKLDRESVLDVQQINKFIEICGEENVSSKAFDRLKFSTGKTVEESLKLRKGKVEKITDLVVHPRNKKEISTIVAYCNQQKIPIYIYGGGSSVNFGFYPGKRGVTLVLSTHLNKIISFNETNQTVKVEAGMMGPAFEEALNNAPELYNAIHRFTCGHFPQSFEYSTVGGWFVTLGSGQQSSYYGDAVDLVLGVEMISPSGTIVTYDFPASATGPKILDLIKGSEGSFGIVVELTWKIYKYNPQNRQYFSFIFPTWNAVVNASREISQGEFGMPAVFRISDPEETSFGLKLYGVEGSIFDKIMKIRGFKPMQRCLFIGTADGNKRFAKNVKSEVKKICKKHGAMNISSYPVKKWEPGRYKDPYLREDLMDYGIIIDTLETSVNWDNLHAVHQKCRKYVKSRLNTICMTHASHFYMQGTNLYFIFIMKETDLSSYLDFQEGLIEQIKNSGGSLSHHHGVGQMMAKWMPEYLGKNQLDVLKALKKHFDPNGIMNPGTQLPFKK
jgi:alkyldihydroxyacetonephosphate synthase